MTDEAGLFQSKKFPHPFSVLLSQGRIQNHFIQLCLQDSKIVVVHFYFLFEILVCPLKNPSRDIPFTHEVTYLVQTCRADCQAVLDDGEQLVDEFRKFPLYLAVAQLLLESNLHFMLNNLLLGECPCLHETLFSLGVDNK